jgi:hypothetical protein
MDDTDNALDNQESVGGDAHGRVVMKAVSFVSLVMPQPDLMSKEMGAIQSRSFIIPTTY